MEVWLVLVTCILSVAGVPHKQMDAEPQMIPVDHVYKGMQFVLWRTVVTNKEEVVTTVIATNTTSEDSVAKVLVRYGPWGYLMLATLLCGVVVMMCGLWEYCCRGKVSSCPAQSPMPPRAVYITSATEIPTTTAPKLPTYGELDQPPDYHAIFSIDKKIPISSC